LERRSCNRGARTAESASARPRPFLLHADKAVRAPGIVAVNGGLDRNSIWRRLSFVLKSAAGSGDNAGMKPGNDFRVTHRWAGKALFPFLLMAVIQGTALAADAPEPASPEPPFQTDVFVSGADGYKTFRIPALITTPDGTLLAFCEGRKQGPGDSGAIDTVLRRSGDDGKTWSPLQVVASDGANTMGNPCPVLDRDTGRIWLPLTWNLGSDREGQIMKGTSKDVRRVFLTYSDDQGKTWAPVKEISEAARRPHWRWYATGPGSGIQLTRGPHRGRLVIPANHSDHSDPGKHPYRSHVLISDDHGRTWRIGGVLEERTNESMLVELSDGSLLDNMRSYHGRHRRAVATSRDGGESWSAVTFDEALVEPVCQACILRYTFADEGGKSRILFSNPASTKREKMTVRLSYDEGKTWPVAKLIHAGSSAYSCLTALRDHSIGLLYERDRSAKITLARFTLNWLTDGRDTVAK
jgi:sialidase-1